MFEEFNEVFKSVGLKINWRKTKIMINDFAEDADEEINAKAIEANYCVYLGQRITLITLSKEDDIKRCIHLGWQAFGRASSISKNQSPSESKFATKTLHQHLCVTRKPGTLPTPGRNVKNNAEGSWKDYASPDLKK